MVAPLLLIAVWVCRYLPRVQRQHVGEELSDVEKKRAASRCQGDSGGVVQDSQHEGTLEHRSAQRKCLDVVWLRVERLENMKLEEISKSPSVLTGPFVED